MAKTTKLPRAKKTPGTPDRSDGLYENAITISYFWRCASFPKELPKALKEALDETAQTRAFEMIQKGFCEGELIDYVNLKIPGVKTPENGFYCRGWFKIKQ